MKYKEVVKINGTRATMLKHDGSLETIQVSNIFEALKLCGSPSTVVKKASGVPIKETVRDAVLRMGSAPASPM